MIMLDDAPLPPLRPPCTCHKHFVCDVCRLWEETKNDPQSDVMIIYARLRKQHYRIQCRMTELQGLHTKTEKTLRALQRLTQEKKVLWGKLQLVSKAKRDEQRRGPLAQ